MTGNKPKHQKRPLFTKENVVEGIRNPHKIVLSLYNRIHLAVLNWYYVEKKDSYIEFYDSLASETGVQITEIPSDHPNNLSLLKIQR
ncbi:MAG: hypothetical protein ABEI86_03355 [Halobacteriaceae archaeon]